MESKDHVVTIILGSVTVLVSMLILSQPWFIALTLATIVSGVSEFLIKEVPRDTEDYDKSQYELWNVMMGSGEDQSEEEEMDDRIIKDSDHESMEDYELEDNESDNYELEKN